MPTKKTYWSPPSGGHEAQRGTDDFATQPPYYEMSPLRSAMFKDRKLVISTAEHTDYDLFLNSAGEREHGQNATG